MSGGKLSKASNSKKKLSERVKFFEVLVFFYFFFQDLGMGTTQKQIWGIPPIIRAYTVAYYVTVKQKI